MDIDVAGWHDFYIMTGGAAAALTGLVVVALSLHAKTIMSHPLFRDRAFAAIVALMTQVFLAAAVLVPFFYVHPGVGTSFLLKVFVIVVLGGIGSMPGAAIGGLLVGGIEGVVALYVQAAVAQIVLFAIFVGVLFVRPAGLLGVEQR